MSDEAVYLLHGGSDVSRHPETCQAIDEKTANKNDDIQKLEGVRDAEKDRVAKKQRSKRMRLKQRNDVALNQDNQLYRKLEIIKNSNLPTAKETGVIFIEFDDFCELI
ncbi:unnamed protein product [Haemonchus placei]|uniref:BZIP domain-containing protein n=1 Tax=Haemonchus placei TaxID=6290 RepID=A0A0N4W7G0_HAEPC|nr:unnamed protein product [Haemonchus placei]